MDDFYVPADREHIKRERAKARELKNSQWWRQRLGERKCHFCGGKFEISQLTMDHLVPVARGGRTTKGNVVPACKACNSEKSHLTPAEIALRGLASEE